MATSSAARIIHKDFRMSPILSDAPGKNVSLLLLSLPLRLSIGKNLEPRPLGGRKAPAFEVRTFQIEVVLVWRSSQHRSDDQVNERNGAGVFFFQAEDGIRDLYVTGVQTCALPI